MRGGVQWTDVPTVCREQLRVVWTVSQVPELSFAEHYLDLVCLVHLVRGHVHADVCVHSADAETHVYMHMCGHMYGYVYSLVVMCHSTDIVTAEGSTRIVPPP